MNEPDYKKRYRMLLIGIIEKGGCLSMSPVTVVIESCTIAEEIII